MNHKPSSVWRPTRRQFTAGAMGVLPLGLVSARAQGTAGDAPRMLAVVDERLSNAARLAQMAATSGMEHVITTGDVTDLWQNRLRAFWQSPRAMLIGFTERDAQFCLTMLARDGGHRLIHDEALSPDQIPQWPRSLPRRSLEISALPHGAARDARFWIIAHRRLTA